MTQKELNRLAEKFGNEFGVKDKTSEYVFNEVIKFLEGKGLELVRKPDFEYKKKDDWVEHHINFWNKLVGKKGTIAFWEDL